MPEPEPEQLEPFACDDCGEVVCEWLQLLPFVYIVAIDEPRCDDKKADRSHARKKLYRQLVMHLYGPLGRGNRVELSPCILAGVRSIYPDPDEQYMGHYES
mmetsp:Transcript_11400/g.32389  ORF Transcript_11400/g.32389 Transcript_11400/m.32389 type:complete len:101 (-) Transcript_11400:141-443(-)